MLNSDVTIERCENFLEKFYEEICQDDDLHKVIFQDMDLRGADLEDTNLQNADFRGADLIGVHLICANLQDTIFDERQVDYLMDKYNLDNSKVYICNEKKIISYESYCKNR